MSQKNFKRFIGGLIACAAILGLSNAAVAEVTKMIFDITNDSSADLTFQLDNDNKHNKNTKLIYNKQ